MIRLISSILILGLAAASLSAQGVIYVDANATGADDGSSWADAQTSLSSALLSAVDGSEIWIAQGTYCASPRIDRSDSFFVNHAIEIYGGFQGFETDREQRDPEAYPTILDGDLLRNDISHLVNVTDNTFHILVVTQSSDVVIDGLVVRGGNTFGNAFRVGAGIYSFDSDITVRNCVFEDNLAKFGGAIGIEATSTLIVEDCRFTLNEVRYGRGAGIHVGQNCGLTVRRSHFDQNLATGGSVIGTGAAINTDTFTALVVEDCVFDSNRVEFGCCGGFEPARGGAIQTRSLSATIVRSHFLKNRAHAGGAIAIDGTAHVEDCRFIDNRALLEVGFGGFGGAVFVGAKAVAATFNRCTLKSNRAIFEGGGIFNAGMANAEVANSILWDNFDLRGRVGFSQAQGMNVVDHCCIESIAVPAPGSAVPLAPVIIQSFGLDPIFSNANGADGIVGTMDDDLEPLPGSPCIDAGQVGLTMGGRDLTGGMRLLDGDFDGVRRLDLGASETQLVTMKFNMTENSNGTTSISVNTFAIDSAPTFLVAGCPRDGMVAIEPYGEMGVDMFGPTAVLFCGYGVGSTPEITIPANAATVVAAFQAVAFFGPQVGNLSAPVTMVLP